MQRMMTAETVASKKERLKLLKQGHQEGILINYLTEDPQALCRRISPIHPVNDIREPFTFPSDKNLERTPSYDPPIEKLALDKDALALIASIRKLGAEGREAEEKLTSEEYRFAGRMQLEEPLVRGQFVLPVAKSGIEKAQPLLLNEKRDGGLKWSKSVKRDVGEFEEKMQVEKLDVSLEVRDFLREVTRKPQGADVDELWAEASDSLSMRSYFNLVIESALWRSDSRATHSAFAPSLLTENPGVAASQPRQPWRRAA
jgi:hypothetical protein